MIVTHFLLFMLFSTIEGLSIYAVALYVFRFDLKKYFWHSLLIIEIINFQNYLTRENIESLSYIAPIVNLIITALFFSTIVRIPLIWSFLMTIVGYSASIVIQAVFINFLFSLEEIKTDPIKGYLFQLLTGILIFISLYLYRKGYGFTFDFEKLRFKKEHIIIILLIVAFVVFLGIMMQLLNVFVGLVGFVIALLIFLFYSIKKEAEEY